MDSSAPKRQCGRAGRVLDLSLEVPGKSTIETFRADLNMKISQTLQCHAGEHGAGEHAETKMHWWYDDNRDDHGHNLYSRLLLLLCATSM